jgi:hypothetical protein
MTGKLNPLAVTPELAEKIEAFKKRGEARRDEFKRGLTRFLERRTSPGDYTEVSCALLEMACERHLDLHDEEDALDLIQRAFRRVVQKRRGPLQ